MEIVSNNYMPGDPRLIDHIVYELKSQGIFDKFRKECIADVDTKPAYQNLRQRVEGSVSGFLNTQRWRPDMNKNQVREMLRKNISESGFLETGVERIVDQVVNPKINSIFLPRVEDVVYKYLGIQKPSTFDELKAEGSLRSIEKCEKMDINLLPSDLEAVSPESEPPERKMDLSSNSQRMDNIKMDDDESPPFEPLEESACVMAHEENSIDSHLSGFSGLASHDSNHTFDITSKIEPMEISNQDTQLSKQSSDDHLSIVMSDDVDSKLEINEDSSHSKVSKTTDTNFKNFDFAKYSQSDNDKSAQNTIKQDKDDSSKKQDEKPNKTNEKKTDSNKHRSSDKHKSRHDSRSESRDRKSERDKKSDREKKEYRDRSKHSSKEKRDSKSKSGKDEKDGESKSEKDHKHDRDKDKSKSSSNSSSRHSSSRDKNKKDSNDNKAKEKKESDHKALKSKESSLSSSTSLKDSKTKEKSDGSKSRDDSKSRSESKSHGSGKIRSDSKSHSKHNGKSDAERSSSKSSKKDEKSLKKEDRHHSRSEKYSSSKRDEKCDKDKKDSKKEEKKATKDDHYGLKGKNSNRRSTDRDSSDGHSGTQSSSSSFADSSTSSHLQKSSQDTSRINSRSNSGDSGNSDKTEETTIVTETSLPSSINMQQSQNEDAIQPTTIHQLPPVKLIKPKFASNIFEAKRLMKIRKKLGKIEKQNQMGLINTGIAFNNSLPSIPDENQVDSVITYEVLAVPEEPDNPDDNNENVRRRPNILKKTSKLNSFSNKKTRLLNYNDTHDNHILETTITELEMSEVQEEVVVETTPEVKDDIIVSPLRNSVVSKESWDAVEAKHLESINYDSYIDTEHMEDIDVPLLEKSTVLKSDDCLYLTTDSNNIQKYFDVVNMLINHLIESITNKENLLKNSNIHKKKGKLNIKRSEESNRVATRLPKVAVVDVTSDNEVTITPNKITKYASEDHSGHHNNNNKRKHQSIEDELEEQIDHTEINNPIKLSTPVKTKKAKTTDNAANHVDSFNLPLSPAESEKSFIIATNDNKKGEKEDMKVRRNSNINKAPNNACNQRYSTDDLYKPRLQFSSSRRRAAKNQDSN